MLCIVGPYRIGPAVKVSLEIAPSSARVLSALVDSQHVVQKTGPDDRRQRLLYLTERGNALEARLTEVQGRRFAKAYRDAGMTAVEGFQRVLEGLLDPETRRQVSALGDAREARQDD
jgi:DNA-binding MarR family transcriptional regulator